MDIVSHRRKTNFSYINSKDPDHLHIRIFAARQEHFVRPLYCVGTKPRSQPDYANTPVLECS